MVIHLTYIVIQAVCHDKVSGVKRGVVPRRLVKCSLADGHCWSFALREDGYAAIPVEHHYIKPFSQAIDRELPFNIDMAFGIALFLYKIMYQVLPHPFFRGKDDVFFPDYIEDAGLIFAIFELERNSGKIQFLHCAKVMKNFKWKKLSRS